VVGVLVHLTYPAGEHCLSKHLRHIWQFEAACSQCRHATSSRTDPGNRDRLGLLATVKTPNMSDTCLF